ncbi:hypothetical protein VPH35_065536 [Triticum aestivum]|uniref:Uncharacterized protein n=1 Tax=Triticum urartu TaxID=4572 RepID=A0A8R7Q5C3_TRIUA
MKHDCRQQIHTYASDGLDGMPNRRPPRGDRSPILPVVWAVKQAGASRLVIHALERRRHGSGAGRVVRRGRHRRRQSPGARSGRSPGRRGGAPVRGVGGGGRGGVVGRDAREVVVGHVGVAARELLHDGAELLGAGGEHHGAGDVDDLDPLAAALALPAALAVVVHRRLGDAVVLPVVHAQLVHPNNLDRTRTAAAAAMRRSQGERAMKLKRTERSTS